MGGENLNLLAPEGEPKRELGAAFGAPATAQEELGLDDVGLIAEYLGGNPAAYGELVRRHQIAIFRLLLGLLADEDLAEEACESVFIAAERRLSELDDPSTFARWILGIAREVSLKLNERSAYDETLEPATADPRERLKREIHAVLQQLAPDRRLVLVLVELRGADDDDVAAALGCTRDEVPALIDGARAEFAEILGNRAVATTAPGRAQVDAATRPTIPRLRVGDVISGRYRVLEPLAEGGMGVIYVAERLEDGLRVALKTLLPSLVADDTSLRRFEREIAAIRRLTHRNFVQIFDHGRDGEVPFFVMELLRGRSLADALDVDGPFTPKFALALTQELLNALAFAHDAGVIHRDLKLDNVLLLEEGSHGETRLKILDLGLAKLLVDDEGVTSHPLTEQGVVFGTPSYMAPEQALGEPVDHRADLYAVAVMLFQLLSGRLPFESVSPAAVLVMHVSSPPPRLVDVAPSLTLPELEGLIERGLAKEPDERFMDAESFAAAVGRVITRAGQASSAALAPARQDTARPHEQPQPEPPATRRSEEAPSRRTAWLVAVIIVVAAALGALAALSGKS